MGLDFPGPAPLPLKDETGDEQKMPKRIQRKRTKGWRMPEGAIYVGRPSKYGNPYRPGMFLVAPISGDRYKLSPEKCLAAFTNYLRDRLTHEGDFLAPLRGKDLACWCPLTDKDGDPAPCHADVLLKLTAERYGDAA